MARAGSGIEGRVMEVKVGDRIDLEDRKFGITPWGRGFRSTVSGRCGTVLAKNVSGAP